MTYQVLDCMNNTVKLETDNSIEANDLLDSLGGKSMGYGVFERVEPAKLVKPVECGKNGELF